MSLVVTIIFAVCLILLGALAPKPLGWVVVVLATLALLLAVLGGFSIHVGR